MKVRSVHEQDLGIDKVVSNIMWQGAWPMRNGDFPSDHPVTVSPEKLAAFNALGYGAKPFPEGDGLTLEWHGKSQNAVIADIERCFGWEVYTGAA